VARLPELGHRDTLPSMMKKLCAFLILSFALAPLAKAQAPAEFGDEKANAKTIKLMKAIEIPQLSFRNAQITDVIAFLVATSQERDPEKGPDGEGAGVNIDLKAGPAAIPPISISLRRVSLLDSLQFVSDISGMEITLKNGVVQLTGKEAPEVRIRKRLDQLAKDLDLKGEQAAAFKKAAADIHQMATDLPVFAPPPDGPDDFFGPAPGGKGFLEDPFSAPKPAK